MYAECSSIQFGSFQTAVWNGIDSIQTGLGDLVLHSIPCYSLQQNIICETILLVAKPIFDQNCLTKIMEDC